LSGISVCKQARGALTDAELDNLLKSLRHHFEDPDTLVVFDLFLKAGAANTSVDPAAPSLVVPGLAAHPHK
jgi:hypothetical protein